MRVALISIAGQPCGVVAGKTPAQRQLDFALAAGCERVIALGDGASPEAIALRHAAEGAGIRFQAMREGHGLLGAVRAADDLLVLAPGLLPESQAALTLLAKGHAVLVLPAGPGVAAGFERIDLDRAWAGALVVPGGLVERLAELPPESEPAAALLRIALQARAPDRWLSEDLLTEGAWTMLGGRSDLPVLEALWLARNLPPVVPRSPGQRLSLLALRAFGVRLLAAPRAVPALLGGTAAVLAGGIGATLYGLAPLGFLLVGLGAVLANLAGGLKQLRDAPFVRPRGRWSIFAALPWLVDVALGACAILSIDGALAHRLFPSLVLIGALHAVRPADWQNPGALFGDRGLLALFLAVAALVGLAEPALMLLSLLLLVLGATLPAGGRG